jgi:endonuclease/exonuclease/phosphatase family metal-dependent hydrolase
MRSIFSLTFAFFIAASASADEPATIKVMSYNLRNFGDFDHDGDGAIDSKPLRQKEALYQLIAEEKPDILGVMEIGSRENLEELKSALASRDLKYPYSEWIEGADTSRHVSLLSRYPIVQRDPHTKERFQLSEKPWRPSRGFLEVDIQVHKNYLLKIYVVHLKSKRSSTTDSLASTDEIRKGEAKLLRGLLDDDLKKNSKLNLVVMGDFNDLENSDPINLLKQSRFPLIDLLPKASDGSTGTYYYFPAKQKERIDYILISEGLKKEYLDNSAVVRDDALSRMASDHSPIYARFLIGDR